MLSRLRYLLLLAPLLAGCVDPETVIREDEDDSPLIPLPAAVLQYFAAAATIAPDFSSGAHALLGFDGGGRLTSFNDIAPTHSDITIGAANGITDTQPISSRRFAMSGSSEV